MTIPFEPVTTFTSDEYGYRISRPEPWRIEDDEGGNTIKLSERNGLAFLQVRVNRTTSFTSLIDRLPGAVGIKSHERTRTTHEGLPALRFERSYLATGNGPMLRVEGLITTKERSVYTVVCGVVVRPLTDPHTTQTPQTDDAPRAVKWTDEIHQATTRIVDSFTLQGGA